MPRDKRRYGLHTQAYRDRAAGTIKKVVPAAHCTSRRLAEWLNAKLPAGDQISHMTAARWLRAKTAPSLRLIFVLQSACAPSGHHAVDRRYTLACELLKAYELN